MDPLSISASVVALLEAGGTLSKLLKKCLRLRNTPNVLHALHDELSDLQFTANDVDDLLRTAVQDPDVCPPKSLISSLSRFKSILLELERYLSYELTTVAADGESVRLDKSVYLRAERRLQELKDEIHARRIALISALSLFASSIGVRNQIQSRQIHCLLELLHDKSGMGPAFALRVLDTPQQISIPQIALQTTGSITDLSENRPGISSGSESLKDSTSVDLDTPSQFQDHDSQLAISRVPGDREQRKDASMAQLIQGLGSTDCHCPCHSSIQIRSPKFLHPILGSFFLRCRPYLFLKQTCSVQCRAHSSETTCVYAFPPWLLERAISISYSCALAKGPELLLRVMRRRNFGRINHLVEGCKSYALKEMKGMLDRGEASVLDINQDGNTILHLVVFRHMWKLARLLVSYGGNIHYVNQEKESLRSPFIEAWSSRWRCGQWRQELSEDWDDIFFQDSAQFDVFGFSSLHKAYLGLSGLSFDQVLASTKRSDIDVIDSQDRTVLSWAAARADSQTVGKLLACGACSDSKCVRSIAPLSFAITSAEVSAAELLLDAKADVNTTDEWGSIPMHYVTWRTSSLVKRMVDLGADIEKRDIRGRTPLLFASRSGQSEAVKELLACGADINAYDLYGNTSILLAVVLDYQQIISILLSNPFLRFEADDGSKSSFFSGIALYGTVLTLVLLRNEWPRGLGFTEKFDVCRALEWARWRRHSNAAWSQECVCPPDEDPTAWYEAFEDMMDTIMNRSPQACILEDGASGFEKEALNSEDEAVSSEDEAVDSEDEAVDSEDEAVDSEDEAVNSEDDDWEDARDQPEDLSPVPDATS